MSPWLFLLFLAGVGAGIVGTIIFVAARRPATPMPPPMEVLPPNVTLTVTPGNFCVGAPVLVHWTTDGESTEVSANRVVDGFPSRDRTGDVRVRIDEPEGMSEFLTEFTAVSTNRGGSTVERARTTGHRGRFVISRSGEAHCVVEQQIFTDRGFDNPNARTYTVHLGADTFGDMTAVGVEISPYPTTYRYPVPLPNRFRLYHDNILVVPEGQQIAPYTGLVRGEWKVTTERLRLNEPVEVDEPCSQNEDRYTQLIVGVKIKVECT